MSELEQLAEMIAGMPDGPMRDLAVQAYAIGMMREAGTLVVTEDANGDILFTGSCAAEVGEDWPPVMRGIG